jgi:hypothetical protein
LPFLDPEDIAHPRFWVSLDDYAVPAYPPVALYVYGLLMRVPFVGWLLIAALPAGAVAAFAGGTARLLPVERRWLALLAPALGFPALYWLMRPWINISMMLVCLCWAFYCWTAWRETQRGGWLTAACGLIGAAAAVRPDYAAYLFASSLLLLLGLSPNAWRMIVVRLALAGTGAVAANVLLNWVITGDPLRAAYQIHSDRLDDPTTDGLLPGPLAYLLLPWGAPSSGDVGTFFVRYWIMMGPIAILLVGQLTLIPLLAAVSLRQRLLLLGGIAVIALFVVTRMSTTLYGADESSGLVRHSMPRYWSPVYLFAALPPLVFIGRCRNETLLGVAATLAVALTAIGGYEIYHRQPESFTYLHDLRARNQSALQSLADQIPDEAIVYTTTQDKVLWSRWHVGLLRETEPTADSMQRAHDAGVDVYVAQPGFNPAQLQLLAAALNERGLALVVVDAARGLFRLDVNRSGRISSTR